MTTVSSLDILKYVDGSSSNGGSSEAVNVKGFMNSAWTMLDSETDTEQKVNAGVTLGMQTLLALFGKNEEATVKASTQQNEAAAEQLNSNLNSVAQNTNQHVQNAISQIEAIIGQIEENLQKANEANEEKQAYQKEVEGHIENLNNAQEILNDSNATKEEKKDALAAISGVRGSVEALLEKVNKLDGVVQEATRNTEELQSENVDLANETTGVIDNGNQALQDGAQKVVTEHGKNTATSVKATSDATVSTTAATTAAGLKTASTFLSFIPGVGALTSSAGNTVADKLMSVSTDFGSASSIGFGSFAKVGSKLSSTNGLINTNFSQFANFSNSLGGLSDNSLNLSNTYYSIAGTIGSWTESSIGGLNAQVDLLAQVEETLVSDSEDADETGNARNENAQSCSEPVVIVSEDFKKVLA